MADFDALQRAMVLLQGQVNVISDRVDASDGLIAGTGNVTQTLRNEVASLVQRISALSTSGSGGQGDRPIRLIDDKHDPPEHFGKDKDDNARFGAWARKTMNHLNAKRPGYRVAMKWAADQGERPITPQEVQQSGWSDAGTGNAALYDYFLKVLHGEPLLLAETAVDNGLEAFRLLNVRFDPPGATNDLERYHRLTKVAPVKTLAELLKAIVLWER